MTLDENETALLSLPTKFAVYEQVEEEKMEAQIEKAMAKVRMENKRKENEEKLTELPTEAPKWRNRIEKTMNFQHLRHTNLPFNRRVISPGQLDEETEISLHTSI